MDSTPFLTINLSDLRDNDISELKKFEKSNFDIANIFNAASDLKYCGLIKQFFKEQFVSPTDEFVRLVLQSGVYEGRIMQNVIERFKPIIKKSFSQYVNDLVNDKIKNALNIDAEKENTPEDIVLEIAEENAIDTTEDELQSYYIVKSILGKEIDTKRITYKDTASYFGILLDGKVTKWICRILLKEKVKYVIIPNQDNNERYEINNIEDLYSLSNKLKSRLSNLI